MSEDNGMKQYLAVETLWDDNMAKGKYRTIFSASDYESAEDYVSFMSTRAGLSIELCGELTDTYITR